MNINTLNLNKPIQEIKYEKKHWQNVNIFISIHKWKKGEVACIQALLYSNHRVFRRSIIPYVYLSKVNLKYFVCLLCLYYTGAI